MKHPWFKKKHYPHIGLPISDSEIGRIVNYVTTPKNIESHAFFPLIHRSKKTRRFRRTIDKLGNHSKLRVADFKERHLYYASHKDYNIFSYYSYIIGLKYEEELLIRALSNTVCAYRSVPHENEDRNKNNIDFADDVFSYIRNSSNTEQSVIALDITSFFDNLDHALLKNSWKRIMGFEGSLAKDHYKVFKAITQFSYVDEKSIFYHFKDKLISERKDGQRIKKAIKKMQYMRDANVIAFCEESDIKEIRKLKLIKNNKLTKIDGKLFKRIKGIPQGSPISAMLANLYLLDFDTKVAAKCASIGAYYRRYSDDLICVTLPEFEDEMITFITNLIQEYKLTIKEKKTQVFRFEENNKGVKACYEIIKGVKKHNKNLQYLGFEFDGQYVRLRPQSLATYYRKMKRSIKRGKHYSKVIKNKTKGELFKARLYKRFTHLGSKRRKIWKRVSKNPLKFKMSKKQDWGNFLTYALMADRVFENSKIKKQLSKSWKKFHEELSK